MHPWYRFNDSSNQIRTLVSSSGHVMTDYIRGRGILPPFPICKIASNECKCLPLFSIQWLSKTTNDYRTYQIAKNMLSNIPSNSVRRSPWGCESTNELFGCDRDAMNCNMIFLNAAIRMQMNAWRNMLNKWLHIFWHTNDKLRWLGHDTPRLYGNLVEWCVDSRLQM